MANSVWVVTHLRQTPSGMFEVAETEIHQQRESAYQRATQMIGGPVANAPTRMSAQHRYTTARQSMPNDTDRDVLVAEAVLLGGATIPAAVFAANAATMPQTTSRAMSPTRASMARSVGSSPTGSSRFNSRAVSPTSPRAVSPTNMSRPMSPTNTTPRPMSPTNMSRNPTAVPMAPSRAATARTRPMGSTASPSPVSARANTAATNERITTGVRRRLSFGGDEGGMLTPPGTPGML
jgi:hypothetical protein